MTKSENNALNYRDYLDKIGCTFRSMEEYDRMLRLSFNSYLDEYPEYTNFYDCTDSSLVSRIFDRMNADPYYKEINVKWKYVPENAFRHYISFLYVAKEFNWKNNTTIGFYNFLIEEKQISVTAAGKLIDILKNRKPAKSVLKSHNLDNSVQILSLVTGVVSDIVDSYEGKERNLAVEGCLNLLEFGKKVLGKKGKTPKIPGEIIYIRKELEDLLSKRKIKGISFSVVVDSFGTVNFI